MDKTKLYYKLYRIYEMLEHREYSEAKYELEKLMEKIKP